jgi:hypothetical protein
VHHLEGDIQPGDYMINVELTAIDGRPAQDPISDWFEFQITR